MHEREIRISGKIRPIRPAEAKEIQTLVAHMLPHLDVSIIETVAAAKPKAKDQASNPQTPGPLLGPIRWAQAPEGLKPNIHEIFREELAYLQTKVEAMKALNQDGSNKNAFRMLNTRLNRANFVRHSPIPNDDSFAPTVIESFEKSIQHYKELYRKERIPYNPAGNQTGWKYAPIPEALPLTGMRLVIERFNLDSPDQGDKREKPSHLAQDEHTQFSRGLVKLRQLSFPQYEPKSRI